MQRSASNSRRGSTSVTIEQMQNIAIERGGRCLSHLYVNTSSDLEWECAEGHRWHARPERVKRGNWCRICVHNRLRGTLDQMQAIAESHGGHCRADRYVDSKTQLLFECKEGHQWKALPTHIKKGHWCARCSSNSRLGTLEKMRKIAAQRGGECLSDLYVDSRSPLRWRCSQGHEWMSPPFQVISNHWCRRCHAEKLRTGIDAMHAIAAERGGRCLSEIYVNSGTHLTWQCKNGHVWQAAPGTIRNQGSWCAQCYFDSLRNPNKRRKKKVAGPVLL